MHVNTVVTDFQRQFSETEATRQRDNTTYAEERNQKFLK